MLYDASAGGDIDLHQRLQGGRTLLHLANDEQTALFLLRKGFIVLRWILEESAGLQLAIFINPLMPSRVGSRH